MEALALACGNVRWDLATDRNVRVVRAPAVPGPAELDAALTGLEGRRLVVYGTDAALAAVVRRLMRGGLLEAVPVGYVPSSPESGAAQVWGLPATPAEALELALRGDPERAPLIRDDNGGVLVGLGLLRPVRGVIYCDDNLVLRGQAGRVEVTPDPVAGPSTSSPSASSRGLVVRVVRTGLLGRRVTSVEGRAVQIGCLPTVVQRNDEPHPRSTDKWTWYRHTEDWRLIRGLL